MKVYNVKEIASISFPQIGVSAKRKKLCNTPPKDSTDPHKILFTLIDGKEAAIQAFTITPDQEGNFPAIDSKKFFIIKINHTQNLPEYFKIKTKTFTRELKLSVEDELRLVSASFSDKKKMQKTILSIIRTHTKAREETPQSCRKSIQRTCVHYKTPLLTLALLAAAGSLSAVSRAPQNEGPFYGPENRPFGPENRPYDLENGTCPILPSTNASTVAIPTIVPPFIPAREAAHRQNTSNEFLNSPPSNPHADLLQSYLTRINSSERPLSLANITQMFSELDQDLNNLKMGPNASAAPSNLTAANLTFAIDEQLQNSTAEMLAQELLKAFHALNNTCPSEWQKSNATVSSPLATAGKVDTVFKPIHNATNPSLETCPQQEAPQTQKTAKKIFGLRRMIPPHLKKATPQETREAAAKERADRIANARKILANRSPAVRPQPRVEKRQQVEQRQQENTAPTPKEKEPFDPMIQVKAWYLPQSASTIQETGKALNAELLNLQNAYDKSKKEAASLPLALEANRQESAVAMQAWLAQLNIGKTLDSSVRQRLHSKKNELENRQKHLEEQLKTLSQEIQAKIQEITTFTNEQIQSIDIPSLLINSESATPKDELQCQVDDAIEPASGPAKETVSPLFNAANGTTPNPSFASNYTLSSPSRQMIGGKTNASNASAPQTQPNLPKSNRMENDFLEGWFSHFTSKELEQFEATCTSPFPFYAIPPANLTVQGNETTGITWATYLEGLSKGIDLVLKNTTIPKLTTELLKALNSSSQNTALAHDDATILADQIGRLTTVTADLLHLPKEGKEILINRTIDNLEQLFCDASSHANISGQDFLTQLLNQTKWAKSSSKPPLPRKHGPQLPLQNSSSFANSSNASAEATQPNLPKSTRMANDTLEGWVPPFPPFTSEELEQMRKELDMNRTSPNASLLTNSTTPDCPQECNQSANSSITFNQTANNTEPQSKSPLKATKVDLPLLDRWHQDAITWMANNPLPEVLLIAEGISQEAEKLNHDLATATAAQYYQESSREAPKAESELLKVNAQIEKLQSQTHTPEDLQKLLNEKEVLTTRLQHIEIGKLTEQIKDIKYARETVIQSAEQTIAKAATLDGLQFDLKRLSDALRRPDVMDSSDIPASLTDHSSHLKDWRNHYKALEEVLGAIYPAQVEIGTRLAEITKLLQPVLSLDGKKKTISKEEKAGQDKLRDCLEKLMENAVNLYNAGDGLRYRMDTVRGAFESAISPESAILPSAAGWWASGGESLIERLKKDGIDISFPKPFVKEAPGLLYTTGSLFRIYLMKGATDESIIKDLAEHLRLNLQQRNEHNTLSRSEKLFDMSTHLKREFRKLMKVIDNSQLKEIAIRRVKEKKATTAVAYLIARQRTEDGKEIRDLAFEYMNSRLNTHLERLQAMVHEFPAPYWYDESTHAQHLEKAREQAYDGDTHKMSQHLQCARQLNEEIPAFKQLVSDLQKKWKGDKTITGVDALDALLENVQFLIPKGLR